MKNKITVIFSSHLSEEINDEFSAHVTEMIGVKHEIHCYPNFNEYSLPEIYNRAIEEHHDDDAIMLFVHNDIYFETDNWGKKLLAHFNNKNNDYQIIGMAGVTELHEHGCWWLNKNQTAMNMSKMVGIVNHDIGIRKWASQYSKPFTGVRPVICIDGLFMAIDTSEIENTFDERFGKYHFYDVPICVSNYLDGCNIGVITDIRISHKSVGETDADWTRNKELFVQHFNADLPLEIE